MTRHSDQYRLFGQSFYDLTFTDAIALLDKMVASPQTSSLFIPNAHTLNVATHDAGLRQALRTSSALFGDGIGVKIASLLRGHKLKANLNGTDLVPYYLGHRPGIRVFLLGSAPRDIDKVCHGLQQKFPDIDIVGSHHGFFDKDDCDNIIDQINAVKPDLLLVGMGNPIQEKWIARYQHQIEAGLCIGVGGLFAYWQGALQRAPKWMRNSGLEWLGIMVRQPWKSGRYLFGNPLFLFRAILNWPADIWGTHADLASVSTNSGKPGK